MLQQQPGDVLEIEFEGNFYYLVVITKVYMFGGNIVYAFHGTGAKVESFYATRMISGFNICTDLSLPKRLGTVRRIGKVENPNDFLVSKLIKDCHEYRPGMKANEWWISSIDNPLRTAERVKSLSSEQSMAMDSGMFSFDIAAKKALEMYTPDRNPFI